MEQDFFVFMSIYIPTYYNIPASAQVCGGETISASISPSFLYDLGAGTQDIVDLSTVLESDSAHCIVNQFELFATAGGDPYTG